MLSLVRDHWSLTILQVLPSTQSCPVYGKKSIVADIAEISEKKLPRGIAFAGHKNNVEPRGEAGVNHLHKKQIKYKEIGN